MTERMRIDTSGNVGIGTTTASARLHVISTTEQTRFGYDTSNYWRSTVASNGATTFDAVGSGAAFTLSDPVTLSQTLAVTGVSTLTGLLNANGGIAVDTNFFTVGDGTGHVDTKGYVGSLGFASQTTGWRCTFEGACDMRYAFFDEAHAKSFIADLEMALAGGQVIAKSVAPLSRDFTVPAAGGSATLWVKDFPSAPDMAVFESGDSVALRLFSRAAGTLTIADAVGVVTSYTDGTGEQSWTFTRNSGGSAGSMSASTVITADSLALDYGVTGNGYYEVNAADGLNAENSPYAQIVTWATAPVAANRTVRTRFGNLKGITAVANEYGMIAGTYAASDGQYFRASNQAFELHGIDLTLWDSTTATICLDHDVPSLAIGSACPTAYDTGTGLWAGNDSGTYKMRIGNPAGVRAAWDGTKYTVGDLTAEHVEVTGTNVNINDGATTLTSISGGNVVVGAAATENVLVSSSAVQIRDGSTVYTSVAAGIVVIGTAADNQIFIDTTNGLRIFDESDVNRVQLSPAGVLDLGNTGAEHLRANGTSLQFRDGSTVYTDLTAGALSLGNTANEHALVNASGVALKDGANVYALFAATSTIGLTASEHVSISPTSVQQKDGSTVYTDLTGGVLKLGADADTQVTLDTTNGLQMIDESDVVRALLTPTGTLTLGVTSAEHVMADGTNLQMKDGSTVYTDLSGGVLTLGETSGSFTRVAARGVDLRQSGDIYGSVRSIGSIALDATSSGVTTSAEATVTSSHTVGSGSNRLLIVAVSMRSGSATLSGVTFGAAPLTFLAAANNAGNVRTEVWYLVAPSTSTATITATVAAAGTDRMVLSAVSYSGVHQSTPVGTAATVTASGTSTSVEPTSAAGDVIFSAFGRREFNTPDPVPNSAYVVRNSAFNTAGGDSSTNRVFGGAADAPGAVGSTYSSWSSDTSTGMALVAVAIKPASVSGVRVTLGQIAASQPRTEIDSTSLRLITRSAAGVDTTNVELAAVGTLTLGDSANEHALINTSGVALKDGSTTYGVFAATTVLGAVGAGLENLSLTSSGIEFRENTTVRASLSGDAWVLGTVTTDSENVQVSPSGINFRTNTTVYGSLSADAWALGQVAASSENISIDPTNGIRFRENTTVLGQLSAAAWTLGSTSTEHVNITSTSVQLKDGSTVYTDLTGGALSLGDTSNEHALVTSSGVALKDGSNVYGLFAATTTLGLTTSEHVSISSTSVQLKDGSTVYTDLTAGALSLGDTSNEHTLINSSGVALKDGSTVYGLFAATSVIGAVAASSENVTLSSSGINFRENTTVRASLSGDEWVLGTVTTDSENVQISPSGINFRTNTTVHGTLSGTQWTLGQVTTNAENVQISASGINFRDNTTVRGSLSGDEWILGTVTTSSENLRITASGLEFRENTTVRGSLSGSTWTLGDAGGINFTVNASTASFNNGASPVVSMSVNGIGIAGLGAFGPGGLILEPTTPEMQVSLPDVSTNTAPVVFALDHELLSGTAAAGLGTSMEFRATSTTTDGRSQALLTSTWTTATDVSRTSKFCVDTVTNAVQTNYLCIGNGISQFVGKVGIGTTPTHTLELGDDDAHKTTTGTWTFTSDERAKRNIHPYAEGLSALRRVRIAEYDYTGEFGTSPVRSIGPIAQEIADVFPDSVTTVKRARQPGEEPEDLQVFNPHALWMANVAATVELDSDVQALKAELAALREEVRQLKEAAAPPARVR